ncbi:MAG: hypothetical protein RAP70_03940 [Candidatus Celaenobacter antarcticus]|nr:hypothetical protein [Candidatus Celaenobacter antarcticus]
MIVNAKDFLMFSPSIFSHKIENLRRDFPKDFDISSSALKIQKLGAEIQIVNSKITITEGIEKIASLIEDKISDFGSKYFCKCLFIHFVKNHKYDHLYQRYLICREVNQIPFNQAPQIPYGYLLNLSAKSIYKPQKDLANPQESFIEIIEISTALVNCFYACQPYSIWELEFQTGETIIDFVQSISLYDSSFTITQNKPSYILEIIKHLFSWINDPKIYKKIGFTIEDFQAVSKIIFDIAKNTNGPKIIYISDLTQEMHGKKIPNLRLILNILSHNKNEINVNYNIPSDNESIDFPFKPLIEITSTEFLLLDKSWCAPAFYEALAFYLRIKKVKKIEENIGLSIESFLYNKFQKAGIIFTEGDYQVDGENGESDMIVETEEAIIIIEFKKKVLTRKSKSGIDINIIIDLVDSLLSAQLQTGKIEILLKRNNYIELTNRNSIKEKIQLKERRIERIALTQLDFGGFQDRTIVKQLLSIFLTHKFGTYSKDAGILKKFIQLEKKQESWISQYKQLCDIDSNYSDRVRFFDCWFLSINHLLLLLENSSDNNSLYKELKRTKHVTFKTLDFYTEYFHSKSLNDK